MKKILCTLALGFLVLSCTRDEDSATVVATWDLSQVGTIAIDGTVSNLVNYDNDCPSEKDNWSFTSNGIFKVEDFDDNSLSDLTKITESTICNIRDENGTYTIDGDKLTINLLSESIINFEVISLTTTELKLKHIYKLGKTEEGEVSFPYITFTKRK